jgi:hypothetical protein
MRKQQANGDPKRYESDHRKDYDAIPLNPGRLLLALKAMLSGHKHPRWEGRLAYITGTANEQM